MKPKKVFNRIEKIPQHYLDSLKIFLFLILVFTLFAHTIGDNENSRLNTTIAIVEDHSLSIDRLHNNTGDKAFIDGRYYSDKPPLPSILALPSYSVINHFFPGKVSPETHLDTFNRSFDQKMEWARFAATVSVSAVAGSLTAVLLYLISLELGLARTKSIGIGIFSGLGTLVFPYSTTFHGTMLGTFFLMLAVFIWIKEDYNPCQNYSFLISVVLGLAVSSDYITIIPVGLLLALISIDRLKSLKSHALMFTGLFIGFLPLFVFNFLITGNPLEPTALHPIEPDLYAGETKTAIESVGLIGIITYLTARIIRTLLSPLNGLLIYSPILLFGLLGLRKVNRLNKRLSFFIFSGLLFTLLSLMSIHIWSVRAFYGPRYLLPVATLLLIPLILELKEGSFHKKILIYLTGAFSIVIAFASTQPWKGESWIPFKEYYSLITSPGIAENRIGSYLGSLSSDGLQSPIASYVADSSSSFHMVLSPYPQHSYTLGEFMNLIVVYDIRFFTISAILLSGILIFKNDLESLDYFKLKIGVLAVFFIALGGLSSTDFHTSNWYEGFETENETWGRENPRIYFNSDTNIERAFKFSFRSQDDLDFQVLHNGEKIRTAKNSSGKKSFVDILEIEEGVNKLEFKTDECQVVGRFSNNDDVRCVTLGFLDFDFITFEDQTYIFSGVKEHTESTIIEEDSSLILQGVGKHSIELKVKSDSRTEFSIKKEGEELIETKVDPFTSTVKTPYRNISNLETLEFEKSCEDCEVHIEDLKVSAYNDQPEDLLYRLGSGWYEKIEQENKTWSTDNSSIYIYNYENKTREKELWLEGRSYIDTKINFSLNGEFIGKEKVPSTNYRILDNGEQIDNKFYFDVELEPGENILELEKNDNCTIIGEEIGNDDIRCVLYGFENLYTLEQDSREDSQ